MTSNKSNSGRIAKNTSYLYIRMILVMLVSLYTSRVVLQVLGISDFGVYNVVGGIVSLLAFFTSSLSNACQRFLNIGIGLNNLQKTEQSFRQSFTLMLFISIGLFLIGESIGLWFINNKLVVPQDRLDAVIYVYHFSLFSVISSVNQVSFMGAIVAHERMDIYAYLSLFEVVARLLIVYFLLLFTSVDSLVLYGGLMALVSLFTSLFYVIYCVRNFPECKCNLYWNKSLVREMAQFVVFNLYGCLSWSLGITGTNILLNLFFGPVTNAARGISMQVGSVVTRFTDSLITAFKPQIIKSYALGDYEYLLSLIIKSSKYSYFLSSVLAIPMIIESDILLKMWLGEPPEQAILFTRLVILELMLGALIPPLWIAANATGNIKRSQVYGRTFTLLILPVSYVALKCGADSYFPFLMSLLAQLGYLVYSVYDIHIQLDLCILKYIREVVFPSVAFSVIMFLLGVFIVLQCPQDSFYRLIVVIFSTIIIAPLLVFLFMGSDEKRFVTNYVKDFIRRHH